MKLDQHPRDYEINREPKAALDSILLKYFRDQEVPEEYEYDHAEGIESRFLWERLGQALSTIQLQLQMIESLLPKKTPWTKGSASPPPTPPRAVDPLKENQAVSKIKLWP